MPHDPTQVIRPLSSVASRSFLEFSKQQFCGLSAAIGFTDAQSDRATRLLSEVLGPWGDFRIGVAPHYASDIGDDHYPIEFSVALGRSAPELRVLFEARSSNRFETDLASRWRAGLALNERLTHQSNVDLSRLRSIQDLFAPSKRGTSYAIWHGICFSAGEPSFKVYLNPQAQGQELARPLLIEMLKRLGFSHSAGEVVRCLRPEDELKFVSLDLGASRSARIKIYKVHHTATVDDLEAALERARCYERGAARAFIRALAVSNGPFSVLPISSYLALRAGDDAPSGATLHFPVRAYARDDQVVSERLVNLLEGGTRAMYLRAIRAFARRPLAAGRGMHSYVALGCDQQGKRVTVYLAPEVYRSTLHGDRSAASERMV